MSRYVCIYVSDCVHQEARSAHQLHLYIHVRTCNSTLYFPDDVEVVDVSQFGGEPSGPIYLDQLHCDGDEENLSECTSTVIHMCSHRQDVGIICHRKSSSSLL